MLHTRPRYVCPMPPTRSSRSCPDAVGVEGRARARASAQTVRQAALKRSGALHDASLRAAREPIEIASRAFSTLLLRWRRGHDSSHRGIQGRCQCCFAADERLPFELNAFAFTLRNELQSLRRNGENVIAPVNTEDTFESLLQRSHGWSLILPSQTERMIQVKGCCNVRRLPTEAATGSASLIGAFQGDSFRACRPRPADQQDGNLDRSLIISGTYRTRAAGNPANRDLRARNMFVQLRGLQQGRADSPDQLAVRQHGAYSALAMTAAGGSAARPASGSAAVEATAPLKRNERRVSSSGVCRASSSGNDIVQQWVANGGVPGKPIMDATHRVPPQPPFALRVVRG
jgi:hypothetical protein